MSESIVVSEGGNFTTGWRVIAFILCSILGPPVTGFFLSIQIVVSDYFIVGDSVVWSRGGLFSVLSFGLTIAFVSIPFGAPAAFLVSLCSLGLFKRRQRIPLSSFLGIGTVCIVLMTFWFRKPYETALDSLRTVGLFLMPALASSALCWRITKNWHSPEPAP